MRQVSLPISRSHFLLPLQPVTSPPAKATSVWGKTISVLAALGQHAGSIVRRVKVGRVQGQGSVGVGVGAGMHE